jgi:hypothetical protein
VILGFAWFAWPVTLTTAASVTAVSLSLDAARNHRSPAARTAIAAGAVLAFGVPALVELLGTRVRCGDGFSWRSATPGSVRGALAVGAVVALVLLRAACGPAGRIWPLPLALAAILGGGFVLETFVAVGAFGAFCDEGTATPLVVQAAVALLPPVVAVVTGRFLRPPPEGELPSESRRAW